ncbi:ferredoxin [Amycolatopsis xylanica]|uniref:Ferredoxin n=1 Tax=Amycolatopsis xylanica TaxID=589385 RepID=A0A1H3SGB2_9PSEU|nr:ferredoxin [Amycolatopsis xylanica]SDZ36625.1 ferredoxin [Amycolatopsis xylanica]
MDTVRVDRDLCLGTGLCQSMDPGLFRLAEDGRAVALGPCDRAGLLERLREIAECCPAGAISVAGEEG